jgi:hypothetical protein
MKNGFFLNQHEVQVIGMSGQARSGKDFLTKEALVPKGFLPLALANHFKVTAMAKGAPGLTLGELDIRQMWETDKDAKHRKVLQLEGTERGRNIYGEDIWCRHLEAWMYYFATKGFRRFVVTDVRFRNEVEWVHRLGGRVYRITGRGGLTDGRQVHQSERDLEGFTGFDRIIDNNPNRGPHEAIQDVKEAADADFCCLL